jgi:hypothetical protein
VRVRERVVAKAGSAPCLCKELPRKAKGVRRSSAGALLIISPPRILTDPTEH